MRPARRDPGEDVWMAMPEQLPADAVWRWGGVLVGPRSGVRLPDRCVVCNAPAEGHRMHKRVGWHDPMYYAALAGGVIVYFILAFFIKQHVLVEFGLCPSHRAQRQAGLIAGLVGFVLSTVCVLLGVVYQFTEMALVSIFTMLLCPIAGFVMTRNLSARRMDARSVWLSVGSPFLESFRDTWTPDRPYY